MLHLTQTFRPVKIVFIVLVCFGAPAAIAQTAPNANRYRMMIRAMEEQGDSSQQSAQEKLNEEQARSASGDVLEGAINPNEYTIGPGDEFLLTISGKSFITLPLSVLTEGSVIVQNVGEVNVAGMTITKAEAELGRIILPMYRDAKIHLALTKMRRFHVYVSGWVEGHDVLLAAPVDRVSAIISRAGGFAKKGNAYIRKIVVKHHDGTSTKVDLYPFYFWGDLSCNPYVGEGDVIHVSIHDPISKLTVYGEVGSPGEYQYLESDSLSAAIRMAQGFLPAAFLDSVEVSRYSEDGLTTDHFFVNCAGAASRDGVPHAVDFALQRGDQIFVRKIPKWHISNTVAIAGEVNYPGRYSISKDSTTLAELISRARGFTPDAVLEDAVIYRRSSWGESDREYERLKTMLPSEMSKQEYEYFKAKSRERPGLLVVDFKQLFANHNSTENIIIRDDDSVYIPSVRNSISIIGSVNNPGRVPYLPSAQYDDYIQHVGGYGFRADESGARVIKSRTGEMFDPRKTSKYTLEPGDTIFVPEESEVSIWPVVVQAVAVTAQVAGLLFGVYAITKKP